MNIWEMFLGLKILILGTLIRQTVGFLPSEENNNGRSEKTHSSITHDAIYRAAADVIAHVIDPAKHRLWTVDEILREYLGKIFSKLCLIISVFNLKIYNWQTITAWKWETCYYIYIIKSCQLTWYSLLPKSRKINVFYSFIIIAIR